MSIFSNFDERLSRVEHLTDELPLDRQSNSKWDSIGAYLGYGIWPVPIIGASIAALMLPHQMIPAVLIGLFLTAAFFLGAHWMNARFGISSSHSLRIVFGSIIGEIVMYVGIAVGLGWIFWAIWYANGIGAASVFSHYGASPLAVQVGFWASVVVAAGLIAWLGSIGWVAPKWVGQILGPFMIVLDIVLIVAMIRYGGGISHIFNDLAPQFVTPAPFMIGLGISAASFLGSTVYTGVFPRNLKPKAFAPGPFVGLGLACALVFFPGCLMMWTSGSWNIVEVALGIAAPLGVATFILFWLAGWSTSIGQMYCFNSAIAYSFRRPRTIIMFLILFVGAIAAAAAFQAAPSVIPVMQNFLSLIAYIFPAVPAIFIADYWIVRKQRYPYWKDVGMKCNWVALGLIVVGAILGWLLSTRLPFLGTVVVQFFIVFGLYIAIATPLRRKIPLQEA